jgi:hypothetical protein
MNNTSLVDEKLYEIDDLQEWIRKDPSCIGDLLIIQKEFYTDGARGKRADLLALDRRGNLVVIENKRDLSGRGILVQALEYVAKVSKADNAQIFAMYADYVAKHKNDIPKGQHDPDKAIWSFVDTDIYCDDQILNKQQRIILVAGEFDSYVMDAVKWLSVKGVEVECWEFRMYSIGGYKKQKAKLFVDFWRRWPINERTDENDIDIARGDLCLKFWKRLKKQMDPLSNIMSGLKLASRTYKSFSTDVDGVSYGFVFNNKFASIDLYIDRRDRTWNKKFYERLEKKKNFIEQNIGCGLDWEILENRRASRIALRNRDVAINERKTWDKACKWFCDLWENFRKVFDAELTAFNTKDDSDESSKECEK